MIKVKLESGAPDITPEKIADIFAAHMSDAGVSDKIPKNAEDIMAIDAAAARTIGNQADPNFNSDLAEVLCFIYRSALSGGREVHVKDYGLGVLDELVRRGFTVEKTYFDSWRVCF